MPNRCRPRTALAAALALIGLLVAGCGNSGSGRSLTLYNGQHVQTTEKLVAAFEKSTGIKVNVRSDDEDVLADQIATEGSNSPADVIYTENSPVLEHLRTENLLVPVDSATLARTPARFNSADGDWLGVSARVSVLIYNPRLISASQLPQSVMQLAEPSQAGKLAIAPSETDFQPIVTSVARTYGHPAALKWLEGIKSNAASHLYPDNETIASQVNRGAVAYGVINQYYWYRMKAEIGSQNIHSQIAYFAPRDPGYVIDVSGAAILKSSSSQQTAQRFLAFLVGHEGQEIIAHSLSYEYPLAPGIDPSAPETPFGKLQPNAITITELGDGSEAITLLRQAGLL